ncbi:RNA-binding KH domain-containing protein PEPPER-like [Abrus precatorius]|uniref:RNA-binding KH domain-containing protein PEPPER-like n=1 Tax=Abrus precatorius TaxID=3816 RepID=A0A8B8L6B4_ABRPR|nr:RNA-binding KH domain-containing protein PEPPER-like [Abrus precatorius]
MSQQGQIPINPMVPQQNSVPPIPMQLPMPMHMQMHMPIPMPIPMQMQMQMPLPMPLQIPFSVQDAAANPSSGKRRREDEAPGTVAAAEQSAAKRVKGQDVIFRIVVPSRQIGKVIGKEGCRIQKIREETKATIKIADAIARHEERVIIISSKDNDEKVTDAERALEQIANLILKEDDSSLDASKVTAGHVAANTIRLLIAGSQAGGLIGMSGQNIEKLRNSSGATITVLAPNQLPLCASAHESDRVVQLSGDIPAVMKALEEIGCQLRENPPRQVISISPTYNYAAIRPSQPYLDPTSVDYVTFEMLISETMVGGLIGRCGSNISRIRNESGAMIKVYGGKGEQKHRQIQFGGSAQQVALAKQRVDEYIYSQLIQQTGTQQSAFQR